MRAQARSRPRTRGQRSGGGARALTVKADQTRRRGEPVEVRLDWRIGARAPTASSRRPQPRPSRTASKRTLAVQVQPRAGAGGRSLYRQRYSDAATEI